MLQFWMPEISSPASSLAGPVPEHRLQTFFGKGSDVNVSDM
jgi:hypothetical protein